MARSSEWRDRLVANGVDGLEGGYALPPARVEDVARATGALPPEPSLWARLKKRLQALKERADLGFAGDTERLEEAGWGLVLSESDSAQWPGILDALRPLIELRKGQTSGLYREADQLVAKVGESGFDYLDRHQVRPGPAQPRLVPYYLLISASPASLDWRFEQQLRVQHAVGRVDPSDLPGLRAWAERVSRNEAGALPSPRTFGMFASRNADDESTRLSAENLARPLAESFRRGHPHWRVIETMDDAARRSALMELLTTERGPSVLVTATHGLQYPAVHPRQRALQGSLVCQEWPGPVNTVGGVRPEWYVAGEDLERLAVMPRFTFLFGCFSVGTPRIDDYSAFVSGKRRQIAPAPFVSGLARRLLFDERSEMVALVGHVDRTWSCSFDWPRVEDRESQVAVYLDMLKGITQGRRLGCAVEPFASLYTGLTARLVERQGALQLGDPTDSAELAFLWTASSDARNFALVGDPASRFTWSASPTSAAGAGPS